MRNKTLATLGLLALLAATSAFGQQRLRFDIPFEFHVGNVVMPAGQYNVDLSTSGRQDALSLASSGRRTGAYALTYRIGRDDAHSERSRLVFNKYGETYFLSEALPANGMGSALPKSKTERELPRSASLAPTSQVVLVARR